MSAEDELAVKCSSNHSIHHEWDPTSCHVALDRTSVYFKFEVTRRGPHMSSSATGLCSSCGDVVFVVWCDWLRAVYFCRCGWVVFSSSLWGIVVSCLVIPVLVGVGDQSQRGQLDPFTPPIVWPVVVFGSAVACCVWVINLVNFTLSMYKRV